MIRSLVVFLLLVFGGYFTGLYVAYSEIDPCRALAVEEARRSIAPTSIAQIWTSIAAARKNRLTCVRELGRSWRERLAD